MKNQDPMWWFWKRWESKKHGRRLALKMARHRQKHQRWIRLAIRARAATTIVRNILDEMNASIQEAKYIITKPQKLLEALERGYSQK